MVSPSTRLRPLPSCRVARIDAFPDAPLAPRDLVVQVRQHNVSAKLLDQIFLMVLPDAPATVAREPDHLVGWSRSLSEPVMEKSLLRKRRVRLIANSLSALFGR